MAGHMAVRSGLRRGFSLVELLVVIFIVVVIIALILPALGGARDVAKAGTTRAVMNDFSNAVQQFRQDKDRAPGVFNAREMGSAENAATFGFTSMENALVELMGGVVYSDSRDASVERNFGPTAAAHTENAALGRWVNVNLLGANTQDRNSYFNPKASFLAVQERPTSQFGAGAALTDDADIPDLVDAWGNPMLLWVADEAGPKRVTVARDFARIDSAGGVAHFYWAQNAGFLKATQLGSRGKDQTRAGSAAYSLLGDGVSAGDIENTMAALLGHSGYPNAEPGSADFLYDRLLPSATRGQMVLMSAGLDGVFMSVAEKGSKSTGADAGGLRYGLNFLTTGNSRHSEDGRPVVLDRATDFNDLILGLGN